MPQRLSPSGQVYSPFKEYFYSILLIVSVVQVLMRCILIATNYLMALPPNGNFLLYLNFAFNMFTLLMMIGVFIHFIRIKNKLIFAGLVVLMIGVTLRTELLNSAIYFTYDFGPVIVADKILFWINIGVALTFIYSDRNRFSWLLFYGLGLALTDVLRLLFANSINDFLNFLVIFLTVAADCMLAVYFWYFWEKKIPFWFLMPVKK